MSNDGRMVPSGRAFNPILPGFHPDPSILRVDEDYFVATSTFEWYPGVLIYHSRDLARWTLVAAPLDRPSLLDLRGRPDSCGVWAPCLSHDGQRFHLAFTDVRRYDGDFKDTHNYLTTAEDVTGPWSDPIYLNSSGFDPSLFHAPDGDKWLINMVWDHRPRATRVRGDFTSYFWGIVAQLLTADGSGLAGEPRRIFHRGPRGATEGPHIYLRDGWYYLLVAEGGTGLGHAALFCRSRELYGPYEADPDGYMLTASPGHSPLLRAGHGSLVDTPNGDWFLAHLCSRPLPGRGRSVMGRESALQAIRWTADGWPRLADGGHRPQTVVSTNLPGPTEPPPPTNEELTFDSDRLPLHYQSLRRTLDSSMMSLTAQPGCLRLFGHESLGSAFDQALVARRQQAFRYSAATAVDFDPATFQQMAGLVCYYGHDKYIYLHVTRHEEMGRVLDLSVCLGDVHTTYPLARPVSLPGSGPVWLQVDVDYDEARFTYGLHEERFRDLPVVVDYSHLSDEVAGGTETNFTGAFVGLCCQDLTGSRRPADFRFFRYAERTTGAAKPCTWEST